MNFDYDLIVIGAGSGGVRAARMAAQQGVKVAVIESGPLGGTCVNVGCVPKKLFYYASEFHQHSLEAEGYGHTLKHENFNWSTLVKNKNAEIERLNGIYLQLLEKAGVSIYYGFAEFSDPHHVVVNDRILSAHTIIIATGGKPSTSAIPGHEHCLNSNDFFYMPTFPKTVVIEGGGYIAVEFAGILNGLGAKTHLVYRGDQILRGFDQQLCDFLAQQMQQQGIEIHYHSRLTSVTKQADQSLSVQLNTEQSLQADAVIRAIGRTPNIERLGLEKAGIHPNKNGYLDVNSHYQTQSNHIYAIGDIIETPALTPVALEEAMYVIQHLYSSTPPAAIQYDNIATAVFSHPNLATVGLNEQQAIQRFDQVDVYESEFTAMKNTMTDIKERTLIKVLVDPKTDKVIGCHMAGKEAGEIIQGLAIAIQMGATKQDFDRTLGIHPTASEEFVTLRTRSRTLSKTE